jgi:very-short-patch-repair endonuclease
MSDYTSLAEHKNSKAEYKRAKELRRAAPLAERLLWNALRDTAKTVGFKFRRQQPIHPYITDFACLQCKLIVELDGPSHDSRTEFDRKRDNFLKQNGYVILHFANDDIYRNCEGVVLHILQKAEELKRDAFTPLP